VLEKSQLVHFSKLLSYPETDYLDQLRELLAGLESSGKVQHLVSHFSEEVAAWKGSEIEERFSDTFDLNPATCLEVGWHLYGEDYKRGQLLVRMRQTLGEFGISETVELPDHISHCLRLLAELDREDSAAFVANYIFPAIERILEGFQQNNPFRLLLEALHREFAEEYKADLGEINREVNLPVLGSHRAAGEPAQ